MKLTTQQKAMRAVKNRLCRIDDALMVLEKQDVSLIKVRSDIDSCIFTLEKFLTK